MRLTYCLHLLLSQLTGFLLRTKQMLGYTYPAKRNLQDIFIVFVEGKNFLKNEQVM